MPLLYHKWRRLPTNTTELDCMAGDVMRIFFPLIFHTVKKTFEIFGNAFVIFRNPFHCRYKELIIFVIVYFLLHCFPYCVFLCVCNVNFEEIILYSMMLNRQYPWLRLLRSDKTIIMLKSITIAAIKVCSDTPFRRKSCHIETGQLICKAIN